MGPGGAPYGIPHVADGPKDGAEAVEGGAGCDPDGEGLEVTRLGVQLHLDDSEASVEVIKLAGGSGRGAVLGAGGDDGAVEGGLEVADGLEGGFSLVQPLGRLVEGHQLLRRRRPLPLVGGGSVVGGG